MIMKKKIRIGFYHFATTRSKDNLRSQITGLLFRLSKNLGTGLTYTEF